MSFSINTNVESLQAQNYLQQSSAFQNKTISEVTSGLRITQSGDDAAGLAIANGYRANEAVLTQGLQNATDGQSQLQIMDGGMSNISQLLDRASTLASESATGTFTGSRDDLNAEFQSVLGEIDRQAQAIGLNTGGQFAKNLSVFIGGGTASGNINAISDGSVSVNLSQSTVDSASLGLQGVQAIGTAGTDIGTGSGSTSVSSILANATNQASDISPNTTTFYLKGPGFSGQGVAISVNTKNIGDTSDLVGAINSAIQAAGNNGTQQGTALANAGITASVNTDSAGRQQLTFNSSVAAFQVQAGDQTANALLGNFQAVNAVATGTDTQSTLNTTAAGTIGFQFDGSGQTINVTTVPTGAGTTKTAIVNALNANSNFHAAATASLNGNQVVITSNNNTSSSAVTAVDGGAGSLSELLGLTTNGNVTTAAGSPSTGAALTTTVQGSSVTGLGSTQFTAANAGNIQVQFSGAGLSSPVTVTVAATAGETLTSVVSDLNSQVSSNSSLEGAGITLSPTSNVLDGNHQLLFTSSSGQAFNVAVTGDTTNQLGFGSFQAGQGGAFDYSTLTGSTYNAGTATTQGTAAGSATLQFSINGQASAANSIGVNLSALPSATAAVTTGTQTIANPITISAAGGVAASLEVGSPVAATTTVGGTDSAVATLGSLAAGTATIGSLVDAAATLGAPVAGTATLTTNVAASTTLGTLAPATATISNSDAASASFGGALTAALTLGSGNSGLDFTAAASGSAGNAITVQLAQSGTNTALGVSVAGNAITVNLATDGTGAITSTASQVAAYLAGQSAFTAKASVTATGTGAGVVTNAAITNLAGGGNSGLTITAATPGSAGNAINITFQHSGDSSSLGATVTGNNVVVNLATDANGNTTSTAAQVNTFLGLDGSFTAIAASTLTGGNAGDGIVADSAATNLTGGAAPSLTFTAATPGVPAHAITVALVNGGNSQSLGVTVGGPNNTAISVELATDASGNITSTADQVAAYLAGQSAFTALANVTAGSQNGLVAAAGATTLTGGDDSALTFTAAATGTAGNNINVAFQHSGDSSSLGATVTGNNVVVNLATDASGNITSTASEVQAYLSTQSTFTNLASVAVVSGGTSVVTDEAATNLAGGGTPELQFTAAATGTPTHPITVALVNGGNSQSLGVTLGGPNNTDFTVNLATNATGQITSTAADVANYLSTQSVFTNLANVSVLQGGGVVVGAQGQTTLAGGGDPALTFTAAQGGTAGNAVNIQLTHSGDNSSLGYTVNGNNVVVNLATGGTGLVTSTATQVKNFLNAQSAFTALATAALATGATGASLVADVAQTALTGGGNPELKFTAATPGTPAYPLTVTLAAAGNNTALGVTVGGVHNNQITVNLATNATGQVTSTASEVASYLANQSAFTALANVSVLSGGGVIVPSASSTTLTGYGNNSLTFTSAAGGAAGDAVSVALTNSGANSALGYSVNGNAITVNLATDANGNVTSTAAQVAAYLNGQSGFTALASVADAAGGTGIVAPTATTNLADGGTTAINFTAVTPGASGNNLSVQFAHSGDNSTLGYTVNGNNIQVNLATDANGNITSTAANVVTLFQSNSLVDATLVRGDGAHVVSNLAQTSLTNGGDAGLTFTSTTPGTAGNSDTIALVNPGDSSTLGVTVGGNATTGYNFVVNLGTDANGNITSTASQVASLLNTNPNTSGLISVGTVGTGNNIVSALSQTSLTGGGLSGPDTNNQLNLTVSGQAYNITLASGANVTLNSIANQINSTGNFASNASATVQNNQLVITSNLKGAGASVQVEAGSANSTLGLTTGTTYGTSATGDDIANYLNQQFASNQVLQKAGLTANFASNQLTVSSNNGTNFRVNEIAGTPATSAQLVGSALLGSQATSAVVQGSAASAYTFATAQSLSYTVGGTTQTVNFGVGTYTKQQVLDAINSQSTLATASLDTTTGDIQIVAKATGAGTGAIVVGNNVTSTANTVLGFAAGATSDGLNAAAGTAINATNNTLNLSVDGTTLSPITLTTGATQTVGSVIADINAAFTAQHVGAIAGQDADGHLEITSNSTGVNSNVQVLAGTANSLLGFSSQGVSSQGTNSNIGFGASGVSFTGNTATAAPSSSPDVDAGGASQTSDLSFTPLLYGSDSQTITIAANNSSGSQQSLSVVLQNTGSNTSGASIDQAISAINTQLQQSNNSTLQQIVAVKDDVPSTTGGTSTEQIKFISTVGGFQVSIGTNANVTGLGAPTPGNETVPPQQGATVTSAVTGGGSSADISNQSSAEAAVTALGNAVTTLGNAQAAVGKGENLFTYASNLAQSQLTNLASAESGIRDADLAQQAANLTKAQILIQAGVAALAQANSAPQQLLTLLRGT